MDIEIVCGSCGQRAVADIKELGEVTLPCPRCGNMITVPAGGESGGPEAEYLYPEYVGDLGVFECPSSERHEVTSPADIDSKGCYEYVSGLREDSPPDAVLAYDRKGNHGNEGHNVVYVNGEAEWIGENVRKLE